MELSLPRAAKTLCAALVVALGASAFAPLTTTPAAAAASYRVLITGDSITQGSSGDYTWRYRLWSKLQTTAPGNAEFVGTRSDLYNNVNDTFGSQRYAVPFPATAHGARWGGSFATDGAAIGNAVATTNANVLVELLGSNDLAFLSSPSKAASALRNYIASARAARPGIDIVIGEVVNRWDPWSQTYSLNAQSAEYAELLTQIAAQLNTSDERIVVARTRTGWDARVHTYDGTHPNPTGEAVIAQRMSEALAQLGIGTAGPDVSGPKDWNVVGPPVGLTSGVEEAALSWDRTSTGASGMFIETRLATIGEDWRRLPYAVGGSGWTSTGLAAGGDYRFRIVPSKGTSTGLSGPASSVTPSSPPIGQIQSLSVSPGGDSSIGGKSAQANWSPAGNASGYILSTKTMTNGGTDDWSSLPYAITATNWRFDGQTPGYHKNFGVTPNRGFVSGSRRQSGATRMKGMAAGRTYAAIGDSYSSGLGSEKPSASGGCLRSTGGWYSQFQPSWQSATTHLACAGATTTDVRANQLNAMDAFFAARPGRPQVITMTIGGNDIGFTALAARCFATNCTGDEGGKNGEIDNLAGALQSLYASIRSRQPYADLLVGGYPSVVEPGGGSSNILCLGIGGNEREMIVRLVERLNLRISQSALSLGAWPTGQRIQSMFRGHNACSSSEWVHAGSIGTDVGPLSAKTFHPNDGGQLAYSFAFSDEYIYFAG